MSGLKNFERIEKKRYPYKMRQVLLDDEEEFLFEYEEIRPKKTPKPKRSYDEVFTLNSNINFMFKSSKNLVFGFFPNQNPLSLLSKIAYNQRKTKNRLTHRLQSKKRLKRKIQSKKQLKSLLVASHLANLTRLASKSAYDLS
ncbi:hypothetical protein ACQJ9B_07675 [Helicobacter pylori]